MPDECQSDCDGDGWIDPCDNDADVDADGVPDNCEDDCNDNNIPDDFVIASGKQYSIKDFVNMTCKRLNMKIKWVGKGLSEKALDKDGKKIVEISKRLFRPQDVKYLLGDSSKATKVLKWKPKKNLNDLIDDMIDFEVGKINVGN